MENKRKVIVAEIFVAISINSRFLNYIATVKTFCICVSNSPLEYLLKFCVEFLTYPNVLINVM